MKYLIKPEGSLDFPPITLELYPDNTAEHIISLLTIRYPDLDATLLALRYKGRILSQDKTLYQLNIPDESEITVLYIERSCCSLL